MSDTSTIGFVVLVLTPIVNILASMAKQCQWSKQVNALITMAISVVGGGVVVFITGGFSHITNSATWVTDAALVFGATQVVYNLLFKDSNVDRSLSTWPRFHKKDTLPSPPPGMRKQGG